MLAARIGCVRLWSQQLNSPISPRNDTLGMVSFDRAQNAAMLIRSGIDMIPPTRVFTRTFEPTDRDPMESAGPDALVTNSSADYTATANLSNQTWIVHPYRQPIKTLLLPKVNVVSNYDGNGLLSSFD